MGTAKVFLINVNWQSLAWVLLWVQNLSRRAVVTKLFDCKHIITPHYIYRLSFWLLLNIWSSIAWLACERTSLALVMNRATHSLHKYPAAHKVKVFRLCRRRLRLNCTRGICRRLRAVCLTNGLVQRATKWQWQWNGSVKVSAAIQLTGGVARWEGGGKGREEGSPWNHEMLLIYFI